MNLQDILFFIVKLVAGTGVFLVGVHLLTENIEQLATNKIKELFGKTAGKKLVNVGIGALTTALIQSSGVTTVLIVGFVNIGIITLSQATAMVPPSRRRSPPSVPSPLPPTFRCLPVWVSSPP